MMGGGDFFTTDQMHTYAQAALAAKPVQPAASTPASQWHKAGEPDIHGDRYDCERAALGLGDLTDDALANGAFLNYDRRLSLGDMLNPKPGQHPPIVWMTAVKDRIRWLSRRLVEATAPKDESAAQASPAAVCGSNPAKSETEAGLSLTDDPQLPKEPA